MKWSQSILPKCSSLLDKVWAFSSMHYYNAKHSRQYVRIMQALNWIRRSLVNVHLIGTVSATTWLHHHDRSVYYLFHICFDIIYI